MARSWPKLSLLVHVANLMRLSGSRAGLDPSCRTQDGPFYEKETNLFTEEKHVNTLQNLISTQSNAAPVAFKVNTLV